MSIVGSHFQTNCQLETFSKENEIHIIGVMFKLKKNIYLYLIKCYDNFLKTNQRFLKNIINLHHKILKDNSLFIIKSALLGGVVEIALQDLKTKDSFRTKS